ncbi:MAG: hypothetical protein J6Y98_10030 [Bacteroidales bacterium]|nr:hypothetical protein [Bacteroidales bacterium]
MNEFGTSLAENNLKGKVKTVKLSIYKATKKFGELKPGSLSEDALFHPLSTGYSFSFYGSGYYAGAICKQTYNNDGMISSERWYNEKKKIYKETEYTYKNGFLLETNSTYKSSLKYSYLPDNIYNEKYSYDKSGRVVADTVYKDTSVFMTTLYEYSENTITYCYDNKKNVVKFENGRPSMLISYDSVGNETGTTRYNNHGFETSYDGKVSIEYDYNEYFDPISKTEDIDKYTFSYEYDKKKNWTKRITYKDGEPIYIEEREITYFE